MSYEAHVRRTLNEISRLLELVLIQSDMRIGRNGEYILKVKTKIGYITFIADAKRSKFKIYFNGKRGEHRELRVAVASLLKTIFEIEKERACGIGRSLTLNDVLFTDNLDVLEPLVLEFFHTCMKK